MYKMMNKNGYENLFAFPSNDSEMFSSLVGFFNDHEFSKLSPYLNWFIAECNYQFGPEKALSFLSKYSSMRIHLQKIDEHFSGNAKFLSLVERNLAGENYIELQSMSGFIEGLRRYLALLAIQNGAGVEKTAHSCGTSRRFIQRLKRVA